MNRMKTAIAIIWVASSGLPMLARAAATDKYHVTDAERAACEGDAISLCSVADQDEDKLLECMKSNRSNLSAGCLTVFDAGLRRRGLQ